MTNDSNPENHAPTPSRYTGEAMPAYDRTHETHWTEGENSDARELAGTGGEPLPLYARARVRSVAGHARRAGRWARRTVDMLRIDRQVRSLKLQLGEMTYRHAREGGALSGPSGNDLDDLVRRIQDLENRNAALRRDGDHETFPPLP